MKTIFTFLGFLCLCLMTSCLIYTSNTTDIPLISKKNDLRLDASVSLIASLNATVSYGLTDKIALQTYGSIGSSERQYIQGAVGYYKKIGNDKIIEVYGGFGYGNGKVYYDNAHPSHLIGDYKSYFMQLNCGKINGRFAHMEYGFGVKAGFLNSNLTEENYYELVYPRTDPNLQHKDNILFVEPVGFIRLGGEKLKFNIKLGSCWMNKYSYDNSSFPYSPLNFGIGLNYKF